MEVVNTRSPSGATVQFKDRISMDFGSIPTPFVKSVTHTLLQVEPGDLVSVSPVADPGTLANGVFIGSARVSAAGVIAVQMGTTAGTTVTLSTLVVLDVYVTKGGTDI